MSVTGEYPYHPDKQRIIRKFNHPSPDLIVNVGGDWWMVWNGLYYNTTSDQMLSRMTNGMLLTGALILHNEIGTTGVVLALENNDYVLERPGFTVDYDPVEYRPDDSLISWGRDWMQSTPHGLTERPDAPVDIHGTTLHETFTRGDAEVRATTRTQYLETGYMTRVNQGASNWEAIIRVTRDRGDLIYAHHNRGRSTLRTTAWTADGIA